MTVPRCCARYAISEHAPCGDSLPVEVGNQRASTEALDAISRFAKLTGDLPALSAVDKRVLALAYMMEKEAKGSVEHLRTEPALPQERTPKAPLVALRKEKRPRQNKRPWTCQMALRAAIIVTIGLRSPQLRRRVPRRLYRLFLAKGIASKDGGDDLDDDLPWISVETLEETQRNDPSRRATIRCRHQGRVPDHRLRDAVGPRANGLKLTGH